MGDGRGRGKRKREKMRESKRRVKGGIRPEEERAEGK